MFTKGCWAAPFGIVFALAAAIMSMPLSAQVSCTANVTAVDPAHPYDHGWNYAIDCAGSGDVVAVTSAQISIGAMIAEPVPVSTVGCDNSGGGTTLHCQGLVTVEHPPVSSMTGPPCLIPAGDRRWSASWSAGYDYRCNNNPNNPTAVCHDGTRQGSPPVRSHLP
jgi:hypothetical protein